MLLVFIIVGVLAVAFVGIVWFLLTPIPEATFN
jgi:hypothetical protein